jgi:glucose/arabinose dehydrogenase
MSARRLALVILLLSLGACGLPQANAPVAAPGQPTPSIVAAAAPTAEPAAPAAALPTDAPTAAATAAPTSEPTSEPTPEPTADPADPARIAAVIGGLVAPPGFRISLYAAGLEEVRSVAFRDDGVPYVTIMNRDEPAGGKVVALPDDDGDGVADRQLLVMSGLDRPHGIDFYQGALYVSDAGNLWRLGDADGDFAAEQRDKIVVGMPTRNDHWSRPFVFPGDGTVLIAIGSSCNACQEGDKRRATVIRAPLDAVTEYSDSEVFARGLRSVVGLALNPATGGLYATNNGRDYITPDIPPDQLFLVEPDQHYGWPYCYGDRTVDAEVLADQNVSTPDGTPKDAFCAERAAPPALLLPPHVAPLGMTFYTAEQFPAELRGRAFIAYHGAFDLANDYGYRVVSVPFADGRPSGEPVDFLTGFKAPGAPRWSGRPVDVEAGPDGSVFITDDANGYLYRVEYVGE